MSTTEPQPSGLNVAVVRGHLSSDPTERELRSGSQLLRLEVTIPVTDGRAETVPVAWFDPPQRAQALVAGDDVFVLGRIHRRFFGAAGGTASRTELVAADVVPARQRKGVERLLAAASAALG